MAVEIERKFLVSAGGWEQVGQEIARQGVKPVRLVQGYIFEDGRGLVRIRLAGDRAFLALKTSVTGCSRSEFEYEIPHEDARAILAQLSITSLVEKDRYALDVGGMLWEIDVFGGENAGLVLAEVELQSEDQRIELPGWAGSEVTGDQRFYNNCLAARPFTRWK